MKAYTTLALALSAVPSLVLASSLENKQVQLSGIYIKKVEICVDFSYTILDLREQQITPDEAVKAIAKLTDEMNNAEKARVKFNDSLSAKERKEVYAAFLKGEFGRGLGQTVHSVNLPYRLLQNELFYNSEALEKACADFFNAKDADRRLR